MQVADSAGSATAFLCGVKGNYETMGVTGRVKAFDCHSSLKTTNRVDSILKWAQDAGKDTGETEGIRYTHFIRRKSPTVAVMHKGEDGIWM